MLLYSELFGIRISRQWHLSLLLSRSGTFIAAFFRPGCLCVLQPGQKASPGQMIHRLATRNRSTWSDLSSWPCQQHRGLSRGLLYSVLHSRSPYPGPLSAGWESHLCLCGVQQQCQSAQTALSTAWMGLNHPALHCSSGLIPALAFELDIQCGRDEEKGDDMNVREPRHEITVLTWFIDLYAL